MGFFSWNCKQCGLEILAPASLSQNELSDLIYLTNAVAIDIKGNRHIGTYDGYGRIDGIDITLGNYSKQPDVYHNHCFFNNNIASDKYTGGSIWAKNQGFFLSNKDLKKYFKDSKKQSKEKESQKDLNKIASELQGYQRIPGLDEEFDDIIKKSGLSKDMFITEMYETYSLQECSNCGTWTEYSDIIEDKGCLNCLDEDEEEGEY